MSCNPIDETLYLYPEFIEEIKSIANNGYDVSPLRDLAVKMVKEGYPKSAINKIIQQTKAKTYGYIIVDMDEFMNV